MTRRTLLGWFAALFGLNAAKQVQAQDKIPDIRGKDGRTIRFRDNNFIDLAPVQNRIWRYGQFERIARENPDLDSQINALSQKYASIITEALNKANIPGFKMAWDYPQYIAHDLALYGDVFLEVIPQHPRLIMLPCNTMYRIETIKGKLLEFQQSKEGPDYAEMARVEITKATEQDLAQSTAIRFLPEQIVHFRINCHDKRFYPYGKSVLWTKTEHPDWNGPVDEGNLKEALDYGINEWIGRIKK